MSEPVIGVLDLSMSGWMAGGVVSKTMALSLQAAGANCVFFTNSPETAPSGLTCVKPKAPTYFPGEWSLRKLSGSGTKNTLLQEAKAAGVDVLFPFIEATRNAKSCRSVGWIPDFQHLHLPTLYSDELRQTLDQRFRALAKSSDLMLFSSEDSATDFRRFAPAQSGKARVAPFPSLFAFEPPMADPTQAVKEFHLPEKFLLVINQFWRHKNHRVVAEALGLLRKDGKRVPVVMAGMPADYRDKENNALSETLQAAAAGGCWDDCIVLGKLNRIQLEGLLRSATALLQPSRFEGWNTSVEDAKALACPVFLSDLPVHREQCPDALGFFSCDDARQLADLIVSKWDSLPARPDGRESAALEATRERAKAYGARLMEICREAML